MINIYLKNILAGGIISSPMDEPLETALQTMHDKKISCLLVVENGTPKGIFTERDIVKFANSKKSYHDIKLKDVMSRPLITVPEEMDILEAYGILRSNKIRHLLTKDESGNATGIVTFTDIIKELTEVLRDDRRIEEIMTKEITTLPTNATLEKTIGVMFDGSISCIVIEENSKPIGLITERNISSMILSKKDITKEKVCDWMVSPANCISQNTTLPDAIKKLGVEQCRRFVVMSENDEMVGLVTQTDIVKGYLEVNYINTLHKNIKAKDEALKTCGERFNAISKQMPDALFIFEIDKISAKPIIVDVNLACCNMYGYQRHEIIGKPMEILYSTDVFEKENDQFKKLISSENIYFEVAHLKKDKTPFPVEISASVIDLGVKKIMVTLARDISGRKLEEVALLAAKEKAEEATKLKDKFVALVAHDLRGPLATILGLAGAISKSKDPLTSEDLINRLIQVANNTVDTVDDLLDLSRIQSGVMQTSKKFIRASTIAKTSALQFSYMAEQKGISIVVDVEKTQRLYCDATLVSHVLYNLISNSVKFCSRGDTITIKTTTENMYGLSVEDTGRGVSQSMLPNLFDAEKKTSSHGTAGEIGTGFGLPLSRAIMCAHGGNLSVDEKRKTKGSLFTMSLPNISPNVLIVDDDKNYREYLVFQLEGLGINFYEMDDGKDILENLTKHDIHLVILDLYMPIVGGFKALSQIKNNTQTAHIPVIISTTDKEIETRSKAFSIGASDFITKDAAQNDLIPRVQHFTG